MGRHLIIDRDIHGSVRRRKPSGYGDISAVVQHVLRFQGLCLPLRPDGTVGRADLSDAVPITGLGGLRRNSAHHMQCS